MLFHPFFFNPCHFCSFLFICSCLISSLFPPSFCSWKSITQSHISSTWSSFKYQKSFPRRVGFSSSQAILFFRSEWFSDNRNIQLLLHTQKYQSCPFPLLILFLCFLDFIIDQLSYIHGLKFQLSGSHWIYTTHGSDTLAARQCSQYGRYDGKWRS